MTQDLEIILSAGESRTVAVPRSKIIACTAATAPFDMRIGNGGPTQWKAGRRYGSETSRATFSYLGFKNTSAASNTIQYTVADEEISFEQQVEATATVLGSSISNVLANCIAAVPLQFLTTSTAAAAAVAVRATQIYFRHAIIFGKKSLAGTNNTSDVNLGFSAAANEQPISIPPGGEYELKPPNGVKWDFNTLCLKVATNFDGVVIIYT